MSKKKKFFTVFFFNENPKSLIRILCRGKKYVLELIQREILKTSDHCFRMGSKCRRITRMSFHRLVSVKG